MNRFALTLSSLIVALSLVLLAGVCHAQSTWSQTDKGCKVWNEVPQFRETVTWAGGADVDGYCAGEGVLQWYQSGKPGGRYTGTMVGGKRVGQGVYTRDNHRYEGSFLENKPNGKGVFTWPNGDRYEGEFLDGKFEGYGVKYYHNGTIERGRWSDNEYVGS